MPQTRKLPPGALELRPLTQGNLSRLCGLYSTLTGIRLALYPQQLTKIELRSLYISAMHHLSRRRQLKAVMGVGMDERTWLDLTAMLIDCTNKAYGSKLKLADLLVGTVKAERKRALVAIRKAVDNGSPVLVCLLGALDHYTVVAGYTDQRLLLFDSSALRWVAADKIGVGNISSLRHRLEPHSVVAIVDDW